MKKTFISGNLTIQNLNEAQSELKNMGLIPVCCIPSNNRDEYIKKRIKKLCECNFIYMLKNWKSCQISKNEYNTAVLLKMNIIYQDKVRL